MNDRKIIELLEEIAGSLHRIAEAMERGREPVAVSVSHNQVPPSDLQTYIAARHDATMTGLGVLVVYRDGTMKKVDPASIKFEKPE